MPRILYPTRDKLFFKRDLNKSYVSIEKMNKLFTGNVIKIEPYEREIIKIGFILKIDNTIIKKLGKINWKKIALCLWSLVKKKEDIIKLIEIKKDPNTIVINFKSRAKKRKYMRTWENKTSNKISFNLFEDNLDFNTVWSKPNFKTEERIIAWENFWKKSELNSVSVIRGNKNAIINGKNPAIPLIINILIVLKCFDKKWSLSTRWFF